jgi:hypothetical protein
MRKFSILGLVVAGAIGAASSADATIITDTIGGFSSYSAGTIGTFTFTVPTGDVVKSATVTINNPTVYYVSGADFYLDGTFLGEIGFLGGTSTFSVPDVSGLHGGSATLSLLQNYLAGNPYNGAVSETLTMSTAPEPAAWAMMLIGFGAIGLVRRRLRTSVSFA